MFQIDNSTAATTLPAPAAVGTPGFFTDGNAALAVPATIVPADWFNMVQQELLAILSAAGVVPSKTALNQVSKIVLGAKAGSVYYGGVPTSGSVTTFSRPLVFTAPCNGVVLASNITNSASVQPGSIQNFVSVNGSVSGNSQLSDQTTYPMSNSVSHTCVAGETVTVTGTVQSNGAAGFWANTGNTVSYIFVPAALS